MKLETGDRDDMQHMMNTLEWVRYQEDFSGRILIILCHTQNTFVAFMDHGSMLVLKVLFKCFNIF